MRGRAAGFTLLEIAIAIAILGVGVVTLQQIYQGALHLQQRSARQTLAVLRARECMDQLLVRTCSGRQACGCGTRDGTLAPFTTPEGFDVRVRVRHATGEELGESDKTFGFEPTDQTQSLRVLEVEVAWQDGSGAKTYRLRSFRMAPEEEEP